MVLKRALLLHDDPDCRRIYSAALQYAGFDVVQTEDPERAISAMRSTPPSVIVTDMYVQGIADESVVARLQREPNATGVPLIVISAWQPEPHRRSDEHGPVAFLRLPVSPGELIELVLQLAGPVPPPGAIGSPLTSRRGSLSPR